MSSFSWVKYHGVFDVMSANASQHVNPARPPCLQSCRFQIALGQACSFQDQTWSWSPVAFSGGPEKWYAVEKNMEVDVEDPGESGRITRYVCVWFRFPTPTLIWTLLLMCLGFSVFLFLTWHASISCLDPWTIHWTLHKQYHDPLKYLQPYRYLWVKWCMYERICRLRNHMFDLYNWEEFLQLHKCGCVRHSNTKKHVNVWECIQLWPPY